ncbi:MAG: hypothetical protein IT233_12295 [Bacteroidia bacterium]|nr:hypothetical protein [Bacteroidia bacterium]
MNNSDLQQSLQNSMSGFLLWKERYGDTSFDRYDFWASRIGKISKRLFYRNKYLGLPFAGLGFFLENITPRVQAIFSNRNHQPIGDAHYAIGFLNLYSIRKEEKYLKEAEHYLTILLESKITKFGGFGWGYTFGWQQSKDNYWPAGTPFNTVTPYVYWAFKNHYELTLSESSLEIMAEIARFTCIGVNKMTLPNGSTSSSYSPISKDYVVNANAYRAAVLLDAYELFKVKEYKSEAEENLDFILQAQQRSGAWYYDMNPDVSSFIDYFHTCFVLKNLVICNKYLPSERIVRAVTLGYAYFLRELHYDNGRPKPYSKQKYLKFRKYEMYDYAEGISLGILMEPIIPGSLKRAEWLAQDLISNFQLQDGHFVTRVSTFGTRNTVPYHRWPQAQLFSSLSYLDKKLVCVD